MRYLVAAFLLIFLGTSFGFARVVVFWQEGFPTVASQPLAQETLVTALEGMHPAFTNLEGLKDSAALSSADLLVLPYGSAMPADAWHGIHAYLQGGGNLLVLGGQPFRVPITARDGKFNQARPQDTYSRELDFRHTYEVPGQGGTKFAWRFGYSFLRAPEIRAQRFFAIEGRLDGLGYMVNSEGIEITSPVVVADHTRDEAPGSAMLGSRIVALDFEPEPGYWESRDGISLISEAAGYARQGATSFWLETLFSTLKPGESPQIVVHLRNVHRARLARPQSGEVRVELLSGTTVLETARVFCAGRRVDADLYFHKPLSPGFYTMRGLYEDGGQPREFYQNAFWVEDGKLLTSGPVLSVKDDFLTRDGKPFFPMGTNYFSTEENGWDFSGPRNVWTWEQDFAEMEQSGVTFVRTGVWTPYKRFVEPSTDQVNERFLRNLEAYLLCARRHNIIVNFTFFAFVPRIYARSGNDSPAPAPNAYIDSGIVRAEQEYMLSIVSRFKDIPWLCWDLINEPNFSNPARLWKGNVTNGDPSEVMAWHNWLRAKYASIAELAAAWTVTPEELGGFDSVPLPAEADLTFDRYGNSRHVRAFDYNLFAQDMFTQWVRSMVTAIRSTGSTQVVDVGHDEGGVTDRVLNQFYAAGGVSFTTNHSYWRDDALLWDSVVAKRPGMPNIIGETGYQPVWAPDGTWRYDEITGYPLLERKWALGFAAGSSGALQWNWAREPDFGMKRSDGSAKIWQAMMRDMGQFATRAAPWATSLVRPQVAVVLPQSLQLSTWNELALEAQQKCVRALYHYARAEAYVVGEYQIELLGNPKLIILPSPFTLTQGAWETLLDWARSGGTLLVSGRFDADVHYHPTGRQTEADLDYKPGPLTTRENVLQWPDGEARLTYSGDKTTYLDRAFTGGSTWTEKVVGRGKVLFTPLPLELNDNLQAIGDVYRYALKVANVSPAYSTTLEDPGILICPTRFPHATLYVVTSESEKPSDVSFQDQLSRKRLSGRLDPGHAAMLVVEENGSVSASYSWK